MKPTVYIETTVVSYLTARPSRDLVRAAQQQITHDWWNTRREQFDLICSELVVLECSAGDSSAANARLKLIELMPLLELTKPATRLADQLISAGAIPSMASRDAAHIGICAVNGVSFLLTWNFKHLANAQMQDKIRDVCIAQGYKSPVICPPDALLE